MNLNEYCAPDGHIISPYLRCMVKGALKDQIESAISGVPYSGGGKKH